MLDRPSSRGGEGIAIQLWWWMRVEGESDLGQKPIHCGAASCSVVRLGVQNDASALGHLCGMGGVLESIEMGGVGIKCDVI